MTYSWAPDADDVAAQAPGLTQDASRTYGEYTYPTLTMVEALIPSRCDEVASYAGNPDTLVVDATDPVTMGPLTSLFGAFKLCAALGVAAQIETAFGGHEGRNSEGTSLLVQYNSALTKARKAYGEYASNQTTGGSQDIVKPIGKFPPPRKAWIPQGFLEDVETDEIIIDQYWGQS